MKVQKMMAKLDEYLNSDKRKRKAKIKCLRHVLKKLDKRDEKLIIKLQEGRSNKEKIIMEQALIKDQQNKGQTLLQQLKEEANK